MHDKNINVIEAVAELWVESGGGAEGFFWLTHDIKLAIAKKVHEKYLNKLLEPLDKVASTGWWSGLETEQLEAQKSLVEIRALLTDTKE
jgi:hypothetical protein